MTRTAYIAGATVICLSSAALAQQANAPPKSSDRARIVAATRFAGDVTLPAAAAQTESFRLSLGSLKLTGARSFEVPAMGFYVASLVTGDITTSIGGQEATRHTGDSWSVDAGQSMTVQLQGRSESALLEVFKVESPPAGR
jgi:hypothetical protein